MNWQKKFWCPLLLDLPGRFLDFPGFQLSHFYLAIVWDLETPGEFQLLQQRFYFGERNLKMETNFVQALKNSIYHMNIEHTPQHFLL